MYLRKDLNTDTL